MNIWIPRFNSVDRKKNTLREKYQLAISLAGMRSKLDFFWSDILTVQMIQNAFF